MPLDTANAKETPCAQGSLKPLGSGYDTLDGLCLD
jgi:hypothetical protein